MLPTLAATSSVSPPLKLTPHVIQHMGIAAIHAPRSIKTETDSRYNGLAYSDSGSTLFASRNDGVLEAYSGETGALEGSYHLKESGCRLVTATHHDLTVLHASNSSLHAPSHVSYHDLFRNTEIRRFAGHTNKITSLALNPESDTFLTTSFDGTFRLWDLRAPSAAAIGTFPVPDHNARATAEPASPFAVFDGTGKVFAVATPYRGIACYDATQVSKPTGSWEPKPFFASKAPLFQWLTYPQRYDGWPQAKELPPQYPSYMSFTGMEFAPDEKTLAVSTADRGILLLDCFSPDKEIAHLDAHPHDVLHPCNVSYSADGQFLSTGGSDGHIWTYDLRDRPALFDPEAPQPFAWRPGRYDPAMLLTGAAYKSDAARASALEGASKAKTELVEAMKRARQKFAEAYRRPAESLGPPMGVPALPPTLAATADEAVSRHDAPVTVVKWHPKLATFASAARSVAVWSPPNPFPPAPAAPALSS
jgi:WD40 repeat protein